MLQRDYKTSVVIFTAIFSPRLFSGRFQKDYLQKERERFTVWLDFSFLQNYLVLSVATTRRGELLDFLPFVFLKSAGVPFMKPEWTNIASE